MQLSINFYRGARTVSLIIERLTLLCGMNGHGKSSVAAAFAALLTGQALPGWMKKKDAGQFTNDDSGAGRITLTTDDGETVITYPDCKASASGRPPQASTVAAGLESPLDMNDRERSQYFSTLLKTSPTEKELRDALPDMDKDAFADLWKQITISGWDAAYASAKDAGAQSKGAWTHITGEAYGSQKGENWRPAGWTDAHMKMSVKGLDKRIADLTSERDAALKHTAVDEHEIARLRSMADGYDDALKQRDEAASEKNTAEEALASARKNRPELLSIDDQPCPECGKPLSIKGGTIVSGGTVTQKQVDASRKSVDKHNAEVERLEQEFYTARSTYEKMRSLVNECEAARKKLDAMPDATPAGRDVADINRDIESAQYDHDMIHRYRDALEYHQKIQRMVAVVTVLAPEGLRQAALTRALNGFNKAMANVCHSAKWGQVGLRDDMSIVYDQRDYRLISVSEQYRVRVTLQLAIASLDGSDAVVIDGADILDRAGRNGLINAVMATNIPALVCMTMNTRDDMPDMSSIGGLSEWIEAGECVVEEPVIA